MKAYPLMKTLTLVLCSMVLLGCEPVLPTPDPNTDPVVHEATGISFPFELSSFTRSATEQKEFSFSADYFIVRSDELIELTIHVYPSKEITLAEELEDFKQFFATTENDPEARFITTFDVPIVQGGKLYNGKKSLFRVSDGAFMNVHIFEYDDYIVRYYYSYPRDLERVAEAFVNEFKWNPEAETKS